MFDDDIMPSLGDFIKNNPSLESIQIGRDRVESENKSITNHGLKILSEYLVGNTSLLSVDLYGQTGITDEALPTLKTIIQTTRIGTIVVSKTSITETSDFYRLLAQNVFLYKHEELSIRLQLVLNSKILLDDIVKVPNTIQKT